MIAVRVAVLGLICCSCSRIIHPAAVRPGWAVDVAAGIERERHEPAARSSRPELTNFAPFSSNHDVALLGVSHGWRLSDQAGLQLGLSAGSNVAPALDGYVQVLSRPFDAGGGLTIATNGEGVVGLSPGVYAMVGKGWSPADSLGIRIDGGFRWEVVDPVAAAGWAGSMNPFLLIAVGGPPPGFSLGVWFDGRWYSRTVKRSSCQDTCEPTDLTASSIAAGLFLRLGFGAEAGVRASGPP